MQMYAVVTTGVLGLLIGFWLGRLSLIHISEPTRH